MIGTFVRGSTTFTCVCCGKLTRKTGVQDYGSELCPYCYELIGWENALNDGNITQEQYDNYEKELKAQYKR